MPIKACKFKSCPGHQKKGELTTIRKHPTRDSDSHGILPARVAELVDAHVSGACSERSAGSSPVPGTKEILQVALNERKSKIFFLIYPNFGHSLAIFSENGIKKWCACRHTPNVF